MEAKEQLLESGLSFCHVGPRGRTEVVRLGCKHRQSLSHLTLPALFLFVLETRSLYTSSWLRTPYVGWPWIHWDNTCLCSLNREIKGTCTQAWSGWQTMHWHHTPLIQVARVVCLRNWAGVVHAFNPSPREEYKIGGDSSQPVSFWGFLKAGSPYSNWQRGKW